MQGVRGTLVQGHFPEMDVVCADIDGRIDIQSEVSDVGVADIVRIVGLYEPLVSLMVR